MNPCGNGKIDDGEECDDKNERNNDGCSETCMEEENWICRNAFTPSRCYPLVER